MKFVFLAFIVVFFLVSCTPSKFQKQVVTYVYDFTKYSNQNFLFTPEQYTGNYNSIGLLEIEIYPETEKVLAKNTSNQYGTEDYSKSTQWIYYPISTEEVLDSLYNRAIRMGADAITRLKIEDFIVSYGTVYSYGKKASGFAIKRQ
jgi:hypothetical protein